jgi:hypothetical protein
MYFSKIALAGAFLALASPVAALAQSAPQNTAAIESAALGTLSQSDRAQVQNILSLLSTSQIDAVTAASQIDAVITDGEAKAVLAEAKKANISAEDAGDFLVDLAHPPSK